MDSRREVITLMQRDIRVLNMNKIQDRAKCVSEQLIGVEINHSMAYQNSELKKHFPASHSI